MTDYYEDYFFTSNVSDHTCPGFGTFKCLPPNACARDPNTGRRYCCDVKDVCWTFVATCANDGSTIDCGTGGTSWCCVNGRERCTETQNQINICWSTAHDTLNNISNSVLNDTYSSLSSAHPSATTWSFSPFALIAETQPALTATTSSTSTGTTSTTNPDIATGTAPVPTETGHAKPGLTGGAIAGIVIGVVALALAAVGAFFLWRRNKQRSVQITNAQELADSPNGPRLDDKPRYATVPYADPYSQSSPVHHSAELHAESATPPQELPATPPLRPNYQ